MSTAQIALAAIRLAAIYIAVESMAALWRWATWYTYFDYRSNLFWIAFFLFAFLVVLLLALFSGSTRLATWMTPDHAETEDSDERQLRQIEGLAIRLLGLCFVVQGIVMAAGLVYHRMAFQLHLMFTKSTAFLQPPSSEVLDNVAGFVAKILIGFWLMIGPKNVQAGLRRLRWAGREWMDKKD